MPDPKISDPKAHPFHGTTLAGCIVGGAVGRGRTSWVCRAQHVRLGREVAIKILSGDLAELTEIRERFVAEAQAIAQIDHPHIVKVDDVIEDQGQFCIIIEFVGGETLQDRLDSGGTLPVRKALRIALQTAEALAAAHAEGVVHRDVKPANILLEQGSDEVKVVDFGLAGPKDLASRAGTPLYMSPEACQGKRIDEKSDVYALGVCLYQMLTGVLPFQGKTVRRILAAHVKGEFAPASKVNTALGGGYDDLLKRLLVASKGYRPTAAEAVTALTPLLARGAGKPGTRRKGGHGTRHTRAGRAPRRRSGAPPTAVVVGGIVAVVVLAFGALLLLRGGDDEVAQSIDAAANTAGATNGANPVTPPPPPPKDMAKEAFDAMKDWAGDNQGAWSEIARRWQGVADAHAGSEWADKAARNAQAAKERAEQEIQLVADRKAREDREKAAAKQRKEFTAALGVYDFAEALRIADTLPNAPGETIHEWRAEKRRIALLADEFLQRLNEGVADRGLPATHLKSDAGHDEVIVEADREGVATAAGSLPRRIPWKQVSADQLFTFMSRQVVSQSKVGGNVFLAVLAAETGLAKKARDHREVALLIDDSGTARDRLREFFPDDDE